MTLSEHAGVLCAQVPVLHLLHVTWCPSSSTHTAEPVSSLGKHTLMYLGVEENSDVMQPGLKWFIEQDTQKETQIKKVGWTVLNSDPFWVCVYFLLFALSLSLKWKSEQHILKTVVVFSWWPHFHSEMRDMLQYGWERIAWRCQNVPFWIWALLLSCSVTSERPFYHRVLLCPSVQMGMATRTAPFGLYLRGE